MVVVEKLELVSSNGNGGKMQFSFSSGKNDLRCKRFDKLNSNKKQHEMVLRLCVLILFQFPMGIAYLLEMNK
jgi:hypothetical protein